MGDSLGTGKGGPTRARTVNTLQLSPTHQTRSFENIFVFFLYIFLDFYIRMLLSFLGFISRKDYL